MNKLYLYACSYGKFGTAIGPTADRWEDNNSFGEILSEKIDMMLVNRSRAGACNFHILKNLLSDLEKKVFTESDLILVQWTYLDRAYHINESKCVMPHDKEHEVYYQNYYNDFQSLINLLSYVYLLKSKITCKFFYSIAEHTNVLKNTSAVYFQELIDDKQFLLKNGITPIQHFWELNDKSLLFPCHHPSLTGHQKLADIYYDLLHTSL